MTLTSDYAMETDGIFSAPLAATQFAKFKLKHWSFQYLASAGLGILNVATLIAVFRFKTQDEFLQEIGEPISEKSPSDDNMYKQIFRHKTVHLVGFFVLAYVGVEVAIGGWAVTY
ncbi:hypothetical protein BV25DRAFT_1914776 [Artomyces pyxidatus]|uniref:Uncharacterized protein n=1 Tax=Artomyces pyxidatus TaxID=48021 RepID=A0ACB8T6J2_9AGAM|nr:hypothetical protein BV25DRAFT_1914776 [Artomyces pyxidatus]